MKKGELDYRGKTKIDELERTFNLIKLHDGKLGKGELRRRLELSPTALSNRLKRLEDRGCINLIGRDIIELTGSSYKHPRVTRSLIDKKLNKRGHATGASIVFSQNNDIWNNKKLIKEFKSGRVKRKDYGSYSLDYKGFTILINRKDFTVYAQKKRSVFSGDALKDKFVMLKDLGDLARYLKGRYELKGIYGIRVFREHYGIIFDKFATWILESGRKIDIKDKEGKSIIWVDDSKDDDIGLKERESSDALTANTMDQWGKDMDEQGWPLASKIKDDISENKKTVASIGEMQKYLSGKIMDAAMIDKQLFDRDKQLFAKVSMIEEILNKTLDNQAKLTVRVNNIESGN